MLVKLPLALLELINTQKPLGKSVYVLYLLKYKEVKYLFYLIIHFSNKIKRQKDVLRW